jgi:Smg protein
MKDSMFDVLLYLFECHMHFNCKIHLSPEALVYELESVGFESLIIERALDWLEGLVIVQENTEVLATTDSSRNYTREEIHYLSVEAVSFLLFLQHAKILNTTTLELVIDRLIAIGEPDIDLPSVKFVTLLVLFNQPNQEAELASMEGLILSNTVYGLH